MFSDTNNCCTKPCTAAQRSLTGRPSGAMCPCEENPKKEWYIDNDGDGYCSVIAKLDAFNVSPGYPYILVPFGPDCDDNPTTGKDVNKNNSCGICAVEPLNGDCSDCNTFDKALKEVLKTEGGFNNDPTDPGGATNKGISWNTWQDYAKSILDKDPTLDNLEELSTNDANKIYKSMYWDKISADEIIDGDVRFLLFDFYVNAPVSSIKTIQETLNSLGENLIVDGKYGTQTLDAINKYSGDIRLYNNFKINRQLLYDKRVAESIAAYIQKNPNATQNDLLKYTKKKFENGLRNRVNEFKNKTSTNKKNVNCND